MTPRLAEIIAAMVNAKLDAEPLPAATRGSIGSRVARPGQGRRRPSHRQGGRS
ncbi:MAG: hypothetical protein ACRDGL_02250 [Candidatus Limnocylindrales bacterium]